LDVFENEPTPREDLMKADKMALTPHIGAATVEAQDRIGEELADLIVADSKRLVDTFFCIFVTLIEAGLHKFG